MILLHGLLVVCALLKVEGDGIEIGETAHGSLGLSDPVLSGHGPFKRYTFRTAKDGPVTISLESHDFDAFLRIESGADEKPVEDDNGGVETNARLVFEARTDARYEILVAAASKGGMGEFTLSARRGSISRPEGGPPGLSGIR